MKQNLKKLFNSYMDSDTKYINIYKKLLKSNNQISHTAKKASRYMTINVHSKSQLLKIFESKIDEEDYRKALPRIHQLNVNNYYLVDYGFKNKQWKFLFVPVTKKLLAKRLNFLLDSDREDFEENKDIKDNLSKKPVQDAELPY